MRRYWLLMLVVFLAVLGMAGCSPSAEQAKAQIADYRNTVDDLRDRSHSMDRDLDSLNQTLIATQEQLANLPENSDKTRDLTQSIKTIQAAIDTVQTQKARVDQQAAALSADLTALEGRIEDQGVAGLGVGVEATGLTVKQVGGLLPPPWNIVAAGLGGVLAAVGAGVARRERKRANQEQARRQRAEAAKTNAKPKAKR